MSLLSSVQQEARQSGLNLVGLVDAERFDRCQPRERRSATLLPGCGTVLVLATAGRRWAEAMHERHQRPEQMSDEMVDEWALAGATAIAKGLTRDGHSSLVVDARRPRMNIGHLAEAAGLGIISPVSGLLVHPEYGPWIRVRAALLLVGMPFGVVPDSSVVDEFQPCGVCQKPCIAACPSAVHDGQGGSDWAKCAAHRHQGGCLTACHSRLACPVGAEHADADGAKWHSHSVSRSVMQRRFGLGWWRLVPRVFRGERR